MRLAGRQDPVGHARDDIRVSQGRGHRGWVLVVRERQDRTSSCPGTVEAGRGPAFWDLRDVSVW